MNQSPDPTFCTWISGYAVVGLQIFGKDAQSLALSKPSGDSIVVNLSYAAVQHDVHKILGDEKIVKVMHNARFQFARATMLSSTMRNVWDTWIADDLLHDMCIPEKFRKTKDAVFRCAKEVIESNKQDDLRTAVDISQILAYCSGNISNPY